MKLFEDWRQLCKKRNQTSSLENKKREEFVNNLDQLFDIAHKDAIQILQTDRLRTAEAKQADVNFYIDQKGPRVGYMTVLDSVHKEAVEGKERREESVLRRQLEQERRRGCDKLQAEKIDTKVVDDKDDESDKEEDYVCPTKKIKKPDVIPLLVPRKIVKAVALNSKRWKLSDVATASSLALIINESNGNLGDFDLSTSTVRREGIKAVKNNAEQIKKKRVQRKPQKQRSYTAF